MEKIDLVDIACAEVICSAAIVGNAALFTGVGAIVNRFGRTWMRAGEMSASTMAVVGAVQGLISTVLTAVFFKILKGKRGKEVDNAAPALVLGVVGSSLLVSGVTLLIGKARGISAAIKPAGVALLVLSSVITTVIKIFVVTLMDDKKKIKKALKKPLWAPSQQQNEWSTAHRQTRGAQGRVQQRGGQTPIPF